MVFVTPFISAVALFSGFVSALPRPQDSSVGEEVAVSAPNGIPLTDSAELSSQLSSEAQTASQAQVTSSQVISSASSAQWSSSSTAWDAAATSTSSAWTAYSSPVYGSGNSNWGGSGYDDCVSQCLATYGGPAATYAPTATSGSYGSSGTGATHTVIVAPTQGVLRYIPFAVNASVGDTIKFMWGANNHTVTKSSALTPCNKSGDALFASGTHDKDFVFTQVVNDTNPTFFYCATPGHCQKGMFGIVNPPNAFASPSSVSGMMQSLGASNPDVAAYASYTTSQTSNNTSAAKWGGNINMAALPDWSHAIVAENVLYTRNFLASNPEVLKDDGSIDLSAAGTTPLMIPQDVSAALNNAGAASAAPTSAATSASASASTETASPTGQADNLNGNGAGSLASPRALVGLVVIVATFFVL